MKEQKNYSDFYPVIAPLIMGQGVGDGKTTACVMAQAATINALRNGLTLDKPTDKMECCCPLLRVVAIYLNDGKWWKDDEERTEILRPLIPLLLDSRVSPEKYKEREYLIIDNAIRVLIPMRLEYRAFSIKDEKIRGKYLKWAKRFKDISEIKNEESLKVAQNIIDKIKNDINAVIDAAIDAAVHLGIDAIHVAAVYAAVINVVNTDVVDAIVDAVDDINDFKQKVICRNVLLELFKKLVGIK